MYTKLHIKLCFESSLTFCMNIVLSIHNYLEVGGHCLQVRMSQHLPNYKPKEADRTSLNDLHFIRKHHTDCWPSLYFLLAVD